MSYLNAFIYTKGNTLLHRLDPRSKGVMAISAAVSLGLLVSGVAVYLILIGILLLVIYASGLGRQVYASIRSYAILSVILFAVNLWATRSLVVSALVVERLVLFVEIFSVISLTHHPKTWAQPYSSWVSHTRSCWRSQCLYGFSQRWPMSSDQ